MKIASVWALALLSVLAATVALAQPCTTPPNFSVTAPATVLPGLPILLSITPDPGTTTTCEVSIDGGPFVPGCAVTAGTCAGMAEFRVTGRTTGDCPPLVRTVTTTWSGLTPIWSLSLAPGSQPLPGGMTTIRATVVTNGPASTPLTARLERSEGSSVWTLVDTITIVPAEGATADRTVPVPECPGTRYRLRWLDGCGNVQTNSQFSLSHPPLNAPWTLSVVGPASPGGVATVRASVTSNGDPEYPVRATLQYSDSAGQFWTSVRVLTVRPSQGTTVDTVVPVPLCGQPGDRYRLQWGGICGDPMTSPSLLLSSVSLDPVWNLALVGTPPLPGGSVTLRATAQTNGSPSQTVSADLQLSSDGGQSWSTVSALSVQPSVTTTVDRVVSIPVCGVPGVRYRLRWFNGCGNERIGTVLSLGTSTLEPNWTLTPIGQTLPGGPMRLRAAVNATAPADLLLTATLERSLNSGATWSAVGPISLRRSESEFVETVVQTGLCGVRERYRLSWLNGCGVFRTGPNVQVPFTEHFANWSLRGLSSGPLVPGGTAVLEATTRPTGALDIPLTVTLERGSGNIWTTVEVITITPSEDGSSFTRTVPIGLCSINDRYRLSWLDGCGAFLRTSGTVGFPVQPFRPTWTLATSASVVGPGETYTISATGVSNGLPGTIVTGTLEFTTTAGGTSWTPLAALSVASGETQVVSHVAPPCSGTRLYRVRSEDGCLNPLMSSIVDVTWDDGSVFVQQPPDVIAPLGTSAVFRMQTTPGASNFRWYRNGFLLQDGPAPGGGGTISGATTEELTVSDVQFSDAGRYQAIFASSCGSATAGSPAQLTVVECPGILTQPQDIAASCIRTPSFFTVSATGNPISVRWQTNETAAPNGWTDLADGPFERAGDVRFTVTGSGSTSLSIRPTATFFNGPRGDFNRFRARVFNACGSVESEPASLATCVSDADCNGTVDSDDVIAFFADWDQSRLGADVTGDQSVDADDVVLFFDRWNSGC